MVEWCRILSSIAAVSTPSPTTSMLTLAILDRIPDHSIIVRQPITPDLV
jgi:hypothetical protein